jgi:integrase
MKGWLGVFRHDTFTPIFTLMKVTVTIELHQNKLRLRWSCPETGKRKNLHLGMEDSDTARGVAASKKAQIQNDIRYGYYDPTLVKYGFRTIGKNPTEITTVELFDRFTKYQQKHEGLSKASIDTRYKYLKVMLEKHLNIPAANVDKRAIDGFVLVCRKIKPDTAKQRIWLLKGAWDWGRGKFQLPDLNPWDGVSERFKSVPVQPVPAFSKEEVKKILDGFRTSPHYANYLDYVRFRLSMATRPQEIRDLTWNRIAADFSSVWFSSNKTKKGRTVPLDPSIASMLSARRDRLKPTSDDELVFTSREGLPIDNRNFRRIWTIVLADVGVPYRKPYTTRKTSVRHSLLNGGNYIEVAAAAGHDPHTMHKYYGDAIQQNSVLVSFE